MIKVYTTETCPKCRILKMKLVEKGIPFEESTDEEEMHRLDIMSVPVLAVDDRLLDFAEAIKYISER